jgi:hypothetical protein
VSVAIGVAACTGPSSPLSPSTSNTGGANVLPDGGPATLKASAPQILSPTQGQELPPGALTIVAANAAGLYIPVPLDIEFEVWEDTPAPVRVAFTRIPQFAGTTTTYVVPTSLKGGIRHAIRARAKYGDASGPWSAVISVTPSASVGLDEIDANQVTYLHRNIANWEQISVVTDIRIGASEICVFHTKAGQFPTSIYGDISIEGNVWVFAPIGGKWYGATWDWLRPGQVCKGENTNQLGVDQIRIPPMDGGWRPPSGSPICFAISARARDDVQAGEVRTNIKCTTVP